MHAIVSMPESTKKGTSPFGWGKSGWRIAPQEIAASIIISVLTILATRLILGTNFWVSFIKAFQLRF